MPETPAGPVVTFRGDLVALGPIRRDLIPTYERWMNDPETMRGIGSFRPETADEERRWYEEQQGREATLNFTIYELPGLRPIGNAALGEIDHRTGTATFGIFIGEPDARGRGYGTEATRMMLRYAFEFAGLHNVMLGVYEFNRAAIRAYEKAGFREIGRRREAHVHAGRRWDEVWMECLATDARAGGSPDPLPGAG